MLILIEKDSATKFPKECSLDEATILAKDFPVFVVTDEGDIPFAEFSAKSEEVEVEEKPKKK